jgi:integrase
VPLTKALRLILLEHKAATGRRGPDLVFGRTATVPFSPPLVRKAALKAWAARYTCGCDVVKDELSNALNSCPEHRAGQYNAITLHEFRHSFVSLMHDAGFSLERIGDYIGHSSTYMTDRYRHLLDGHEKQAADILDAYFERSGAQRGAHGVAESGNTASLHASGLR